MRYREQTKKKQKEKGILKQTGERLMETQDVNNSQIGGSQVLFPDSQSSIQSFGRLQEYVVARENKLSFQRFLFFQK